MLVNNLLSQQHHDYISDILLGDRFPHYYSGNINSSNFTDKYDNDVDATGFAHRFFDDGVKQSDALDVILPYLWALLERNNLKLQQLLRVRSVLTIPTGGQHSGYPHIDMTAVQGYKTAIVYIAGTDGDTVLYNETFDGRILPDVNELTECCRITPQPNSGFVFDGSRYHTGLLPQTSKVRLVLNYNFTATDTEGE